MALPTFLGYRSSVAFVAPDPLRPGDGIYVVAPSGAFDRQALNDGLDLIAAAGFEPIVNESIFARHRYMAGTDELRIEVFAAALASGCGAIWAARGGYGATRILGALKVAVSSAAPLPWLVGFSDITAVHGLWQRAGYRSLHGANITTLASWGGLARDSLWSILRGEAEPVALVGQWHQPRALALPPQLAGPLVGGNLAVLAATCGTGDLPSFADSIVLLEDVGEAPYRLDRALTQLRHASDLTAARAVVLGQFSGCGATDEAAEILTKELLSVGLPVLSGIGVGHEPSSLPVVLGGPVSIDCHTATLYV